MLLYYITDRHGFAGTDAQQRTALLRRIADAARAGVDYIQLREKDLPSHELGSLAQEAVHAVRENSSNTKLLINRRIDIALACGADGVHLPSGDLRACEVRAVWTKCSVRDPLIGVSAHSLADIREAAVEGASFAVLAPIFEKVQSGAKGIGLDALREACSATDSVGGISASRRRFPVLALGGVNLTNARACIEAGAAGVAGLRLFQTEDVLDTVRQLRDL
jgi:thiamine-phosphate pyrophosphorylase